jgi:HlyD family secretion protein
MNKKRFLLVGLIAFIVIAVIIALSFRSSDNGDTLVLSGNVEVTEAHVGFKLPGRVIELFVDEGYKVVRDDKLAQLDRDELSKMVDQQKASVGEASDRFSELRSGSRRQEIEQAKAGLAAANADLEKAKKDFSRAEMIFKKLLIIIRGVFLKGCGFDVLWPQMAVLFALGSIIITLSSLRFRKRLG